MTLREHEPLASHCTLGVGGPARFFTDAHDEEHVIAAWRWARTRGLPLRILGGGSNLVVADEGVDGLVVRIGVRETAQNLAFRATLSAIENCLLEVVG